ncbi:XVIPCD domain-containing protein [Frateuria terrea]|uniref:Putative peptidoglycan binding domain-containing protein n=1 Tax=Frateuria terrea TaxID=529704 RepID=A0A1H6QQ79_9GAMM|nr:XVIPCD domain-containing protein [Frateuria terrea]SEI44166.1 Putative peptidoglycan binding domain-containing protein [Frateuria terrea]SFP09713.1 Putative peptidoglycan binding domain-containing protein [Frateuria terrea]
MSSLDTHDIDAVAGAIYFIVGRGTEGGASSYQLSVAGITAHGPHSNWGDSHEVVANSGYSIGTIQVDLGQRGEWPLGATQSAPAKRGQTTYVDGLIAEASKYAQDHDLKFPSDKVRLRAELLTHGNGERGRGTLAFLEPDTRDSFNAWAASEGGERWIHQNIDYPQIRNVTKVAMEMLAADGQNIHEDRRLEAIAILAKTANQMPGKLAEFRQVLRSGGDYDDVLAKADDIKRHHRHYAAPEAAVLAGRYGHAYDNPAIAAALDRAQVKVATAGFNPSAASTDSDFRKALRAIGRDGQGRVLRQGSRGDQVTQLQASLAKLGITDARGLALHPDGAFGPSTQAAVETFQRAHGLKPDGLVGPETLGVLHEATRQRVTTLADVGHPGNPMFRQALERVHVIDAQHGRAPDAFSRNLAGSLATAAYVQGLARIDHVILGGGGGGGGGGERAFAIEGDPRSPLKQIACVDVTQAIARPLEQSSAEFLALSRQENPHHPQEDQLQPSLVQSPVEAHR